MKKLTTLLSALFVAGAAQAGTLSEPMVESDVEEAAASSSAGWLPLLLIAGVAALLVSTGEADKKKKGA